MIRLLPFLTRALLASAITTFSASAAADGFSLVGNKLDISLSDNPVTVNVQSNGSFGKFNLTPEKLLSQTSALEIPLALQALGLADGEYKLRLGLILQDQDTEARLEAGLGAVSITIKDDELDTIVIDDSESTQLVVTNGTDTRTATFDAGNGALSPDEEIYIRMPDALYELQGNSAVVDFLKTFGDLNDARNINIRLVMQPLTDNVAFGVQDGQSFTALPRMQTTCTNSPSSQSDANFTLSGTLAAAFSSAYAISGILQLGADPGEPGAAFTLLSEDCAEEETSDETEEATPPSAADTFQQSILDADAQFVSDAGDQSVSGVDPSARNNFILRAFGINTQSRQIADQLTVPQTIVVIDSLTGTTELVTQIANQNMTDPGAISRHLLEAQNNMMEEMKQKQLEAQRQTQLIQRLLLSTAQQNALKEDMVRLLKSQTQVQSKISQQEVAYKNKELLGSIASMQLDLGVKLDGSTTQEFASLLMKHRDMTEQETSEEFKDFDKLEEQVRRRKLQEIEHRSAKLAVKQQKEALLRGKLAANAASKKQQSEVSKFDEKKIDTSGKFSDEKLKIAMLKRMTAPPEASNILAATASPLIDRDPDSGEILITMPNGEQYLTQLTAVRFLPSEDLTGMVETSNGAHLIYTDGLALDMSAIPVNTDALFSAVIDMGYVPSLRNDGVLSIELGNGERFAGAFGFEDISGGDGDCSEVTIKDATPVYPVASEVAFIAECSNGVTQRISPAIDDTTLYAMLQADGLNVTTNRFSGVISIEGVGSFRPSYFVTPLQPADNNLLAFNGNPWDVGLRAVDTNSDGIMDYEFVTRNGVQLIYSVPTIITGEFIPGPGYQGQ
ncbi:MAG: hypothetical protein WD600_14060 [Pseudohongiella sp.]